MAALRILARRPTLSLVAILTTALAVGANTAIFSVARAVFLRPLGFPGEQRLVEIRDCNEAWHRRNLQRGHSSADPRGCITVSGALYQDFLAQAHSYEVLGAMTWGPDLVALAGPSEPVLARGYRVTPTFFQALGVRPLAGHWFDDYAGRADWDREVVLGYGLWKDRFGGDPSIVGRDIQVADAAHRVVGVMPPGFTYPGRTDLWLPHRFGTAAYQAAYSARNLILIGRLKPGVGLEAAQAEAGAISARAAAIHPKFNAGWTARIGGLVEEMTFTHRRAFVLLSVAVAIVLLIACANLSNLVLASLEGRSTEMSIRTALGAQRKHLFRQIVGESLVLSLSGGLVGLLLVFWGLDLLRPLIPANIPRAETVRIDVAVALFSMAASLAAGLIFGLLPALRASDARLGGTLRAGLGRTTTPGSVTLRGALVAVQVSFAVVLLAAAGLLLNSLRRLAEQDMGFRSDHLLVARVPLSRARYGTGVRRAAFSEDLLREVEQQPGVLAAAVGFPLPFTGDQQGRDGVEFEGHTVVDLGIVQYRVVSPNYFAALSIPLLQGRPFHQSERSEVCIVNRTLARRVFGAESPVGRHLRTGKPWIEIVGVVGDVRQLGLDKEAGPEMYIPWRQDPFPVFTLVARHQGNHEALAAALHRLVWRVDPNQALGEVATMDQLIADSTSDRRFPLLLFSLFGSLALGIAAVGIYGVVSHSVASRTQEIGIRRALGAGAGDLVKLVLGQALLPVAAGLAAGLCLAVAATRSLGSLLFGVRPNDPLTLAAACVVLGVVAVAAALGPSLRACRTDPVEALRYC